MSHGARCMYHGVGGHDNGGGTSPSDDSDDSESDDSNSDDQGRALSSAAAPLVIEG